MGVSQESAKVVYEALRAAGVRLVAALPESWLTPVIVLAQADPDVTLVEVAKEEEAVGVAMGAHLAGTRAAVLMQNHGLLASVNGIVSGAMLYRVPLLLMVSDRGHLGETDPWQTEGGRATRPLLDALGIVWPSSPGTRRWSGRWPTPWCWLNFLSSGGTPTPTADAVDLTAVARGTGIAEARTVATLEEFVPAVREDMAAERFTFLLAKVEPVGPAGFHMDLHLLENRFAFARALAGQPAR